MIPASLPPPGLAGILCGRLPGMSPRETVVQGLVGVGFGVVWVALSRWGRSRPELERPTLSNPLRRHLFTINEGIGWLLIVVGVVTVVVELARSAFRHRVVTRRRLSYSRR
jgi:hypothetical protein